MPERVTLTLSGVDKNKYKIDEMKNTDILKMYLE